MPSFYTYFFLDSQPGSENVFDRSGRNSRTGESISGRTWHENGGAYQKIQNHKIRIRYGNK
jgi:hypothetical protein